MYVRLKCNELFSKVDVHFDNQVLRLTSKNCEAKHLLENVFQNETIVKPDKFKKIQNVHQFFACVLRYDGQCQGKKLQILTYIFQNIFNFLKMNFFQERIIEDFESIPVPEETKFHIEIKECPFKYEFLRRPSLIFPSDKCFIQKEYNKTCHENYIQVHKS